MEHVEPVEPWRRDGIPEESIKIRRALIREIREGNRPAAGEYSRLFGEEVEEEERRLEDYDPREVLKEVAEMMREYEAELAKLQDRADLGTEVDMRIRELGEQLKKLREIYIRFLERARN